MLLDKRTVLGVPYADSPCSSWTRDELNSRYVLHTKVLCRPGQGEKYLEGCGRILSFSFLLLSVGTGHW